MKADVLVIGGGPSGLLAAAAAAQNGSDVILADKNQLLAKKLRITGKGRCNITNIADISDFIPCVRTNPSFMYSAFYSFTNNAVIALLNSLGVETKTERGGRVFPKSDSARDVAEALIKHAKNNGVRFVTERITGVNTENTAVTGAVTSSGQIIEASSVIIATGGKSYPLTGSTGDGYKIAMRLGHSVVAPVPSLVPLTVTEKWVGELQGLSLKNIAVKIKNESEKTVYDDFGEMLFTDKGVSGPVILSASANIKNVGNTAYRLIIDLKPALDEQTLDLRIQRDFAESLNKNFSNSLGALLPKKLIPVIIKLSGINPETKINLITREQRHTLAKLLKEFTLNISGTAPIDEAIITSGGVSVKEINPSTMESKIISRLYFAGEVIDVDAYTGGYNLQIAFSTGYLAGSSAAHK